MKNFIGLKALFLFLSLLLFVGCAKDLQPTISSDNQNSIQISETGIDAAEPAVAAAPDGGIFVVWVEHGTGKTADVFLQKFDIGGKTVSEKTRVNANAGEATAWRGDPPTLVVGAAGAIYVGWTKRVKTETATGTDFYISVSRDGGKTFQSAVKVNDDAAPASHGMHSLAVDKNGKIFAAWLDERNIKKHAQNKFSPHFEFVRAQHTPAAEQAQEAIEPNSEVFFAVSSDDGKSFSANKKLSSEVCPCCKTAVLAAPNGAVYVSWRQVVGDNFRHIAVTSSSDGGENFTTPTIVSDDRWQILGCPVSGASLGVNQNNRLKIVWFTAGASGMPGLYESESNDNAKTFSPRKLISEGTDFGTPAMVSDKTFWSRNQKLYFADESNKTKEIGTGEQTSATVFENKVFVAFVKKEKERRSVLLSILNR